MRKIRNYLTAVSYLIAAASLFVSSGCASDSYAAKGAAEGATTGALAGAVGGMVTSLVFGRNIAEAGAEADAEARMQEALQELQIIRGEYDLPTVCPS